jgi:hypothetical protein
MFLLIIENQGIVVHQLLTQIQNMDQIIGTLVPKDNTQDPIDKNRKLKQGLKIHSTLLKIFGFAKNNLSGCEIK